MQMPRPNFLLLLICACGAVNVLFYSLTNGPTGSHAVKSEHKFINLQDTDESLLPQIANDGVTNNNARMNPVTEERFGADQRVEELDTDTRIQNSARKLANAHISENQSSKYSTDETARTFTFSISKYDACLENGTENYKPFDIVIVVMSEINNFLRRHAIRNTWGSVANDVNATVLFLVGKSKSLELQPQVEKEAELYNDIIQVDLIDSYDTLTLKSISMLQWLNDYCMSSTFYLKADDDVYINAENVLKAAKSRGEMRFFLCHVFNRAEPIRNPNSKWFTSYNDYSEKYFPSYCSGTAYLFSSSILPDLFNSALRTKWFMMEDVFISGLAAKSINVSHVHDDGFSYMKRKPTGCVYEKVLSGHQVTVRQMYVIFAQLTSHEINCDTHKNKVIQNAEEIN